MKRTLGAILCLLLGLWGEPRVLGADREYEVKAQILIEVLQWVQWPHLDGPANVPFELVVLGKSPFGADLDRVAQSRTIRQRPIRIRYLRRLSEVGHCEALFLCGSESASIDQIRAWARANRVLTLGDTRILVDKGVMVNLILTDEGKKQSRQILAINPDESKASGLSIDPRVLRGAQIISTPRAPEAPASERQPR